ncbi:cupin domain-containing protein [Streptomyces sp. NPDC005492]|uniref:JmjC domain-containing protein n=1 Tax=Streptomyces sp. NPDC005492 TaxID=3156883 RepID=UPI0033AAEAA7
MEIRDSPFETASAFLTPLAAMALPGIRLAHDRLTHEKGVFTEEWLAGRPLPLADARQPGQTVALVDGDGFTRSLGADSATHDHDVRPRTRVYESLHVRSNSWVSLTALHLAGLLRRDVVCTAYESHAGDLNLGPHDDLWTGLIVQISGAKRWLVWPNPQAAPEEFVMRTGDVMVLPRRMKHDVSTPENPGYSLHLVFAITDRPIEAWSAPQSSGVNHLDRDERAIPVAG